MAKLGHYWSEIQKTDKYKAKAQCLLVHKYKQISEIHYYVVNRLFPEWRSHKEVL